MTVAATRAARPRLVRSTSCLVLVAKLRHGGAVWTRRPDRAAMTRRGRMPDGVAGGASIAGVPLHVTGTFIAVAIVLGFFAGRDVASTSLIDLPSLGSLDEALRAFEPGGPAVTVTKPSSGRVVAAGLGVALVYALSVLAHELGHLTAARLVGIDVAAVQLHAAGGFVEMDDDRLTAGRLAWIAGAGPLVTSVLALVAGVLLTALGWSLTGVPASETGGGVALGRVLSGAPVVCVEALDAQARPAPRISWKLRAAAALSATRG